MPMHERRVELESLLATVGAPVHLTPMTRDRAVAADWLNRFEGAGLDGVMAKPQNGRYEPGKRAMFKIKHARTADCVVAGFRWHKTGPGTLVGSLLLGLYDAKGTLHHVGVTSSFTMAARKALVAELEPLRTDALSQHPWRAWAEANGLGSGRDARRTEPLERRKGSLVGTAADRARLRGQVRSSAGRPLPSRRDVSPLARGPNPRRLPVRSARGHCRVRTGQGVRCGRAAAPVAVEMIKEVIKGGLVASTSTLAAVLSVLVLAATVPEPVKFTALDEGAQSGIEHSREVAVRTSADWKSLCSEHAPGHRCASVNFSKTMVVGVFLGRRPTTGYGVEIASIEHEGNSLLVTYRELTPNPDAMMPQMLTAPFVLVTTDPFAGPVTFIHAKQ